MPKYSYKCDRCGHTFETYQGIKDNPLTVCRKCNDNTLYRVIGNPIVIYKGTGFYSKDNKK